MTHREELEELLIIGVEPIEPSGVDEEDLVSFLEALRECLQIFGEVEESLSGVDWIQNHAGTGRDLVKELQLLGR